MNKTYVFPRKDDDAARFQVKTRPISGRFSRASSTGKLLTIHDFAKLELEEDKKI